MLEIIKKKYREIINASRSNSLDPGELEEMMKEFFEKDVPALIWLAEQDDTEID